MFILLIGCGGVTKVLKAPIQVTKPVVPKSVAIFPLADYSQRKPFIEAYPDPNLLIIEEITQNLAGYGFKVALQEDVNGVLFSEKILIPVPVQVSKRLENFKREASTPGTMEWDYFNTPHLEEIKEIYGKEILEKYKEPDIDSLSFEPKGVSKGLNQEIVTKLARELNADIIFRGRILEYGFKDRNTLSPLHGAGLLPLLINEPKKVIFGVTSKDGYDTGELIRDAIESTLIGGAIGGGIGAAAHGGEAGGLMGGGLGLLQADKKLPDVESSVMHIRLYAQDGKTGQVIWTNAIEVERTPASRFAFDEKHPKVLLDKLTREGVKLLVSDFIKNTGFLN